MPPCSSLLWVLSQPGSNAALLAIMTVFPRRGSIPTLDFLPHPNRPTLVAWTLDGPRISSEFVKGFVQKVALGLALFGVTSMALHCTIYCWFPRYSIVYTSWLYHKHRSHPSYGSKAVIWLSGDNKSIDPVIFTSLVLVITCAFLLSTFFQRRMRLPKKKKSRKLKLL